MVETKIDEAIKSATQIANAFAKDNFYCLVEIFHNSFFYSRNPECNATHLQPNPTEFKIPPQVIITPSELTMLDGADGMSLRISEKIESLYSHTAFESWESIQRLHGRSNSSDEISALINCLNQDSESKLPLLFVTTLHLRDVDYNNISSTKTLGETPQERSDKQVNKIKKRFKDELGSSCTIAFLDSLDTASLIVIINSSSYSKVVDFLERTLSSFPGMISNTHVGLLKKKEDEWDVHDEIGRCRLHVALKDTSGQKKFIETLTNKIALPANKIIPYSNLGIYDIIFELNGNSPLSSKSILKAINAIRSESAEAFYDFTVTIENAIDESELPESKSELLGTPSPACGLNKSIFEFIEHQSNIFNDKYKSEPKPAYATAMYLFDILISISKKIQRACEEGHEAPLVPMMLSALDGFKSLFETSNRDDPEYALISLSKFVTELYYVYRSSMYGVVEPQMLDGASLFRDIPERLVKHYYEFIDSTSYFIRSVKSGDQKPMFFYLLVPGVSPSVRTERLFYSQDLNSRLLIIHFPRVMLFDAKTLMPSLIHEIAHYSGVDERRRPERQNTIFDLVAYYILHQINKKVTNESFMFMKQLLYRNFIKAEAEDKSKYPRAAEKNDGKYYGKYNSEMLESMGPILRESIYRLFDDQSIGDWAEVAAIAEKVEPLEYRDALTESLATGLFGQLLVFINSLLDIFSEVYADIVAIHLLNLSFEEYLHMLWQNGNDFSMKTSIQERIQIVLDTIWGSTAEEFIDIRPNWLSEEKYNIILEWRHNDGSKSEATNVYPTAIRQHIVDHFCGVIEEFGSKTAWGEYFESVKKLGEVYHSISY